MRSKIYLNFLFAFTLVLSLLNPASAQINSKTLHDIQLLLQEKESRTPAQKKMDSRLLQAAREKRGQKMAQGVDLVAADVHAEKDGRVKVDISADVTDELISKIRSVGGEILFSSKEYHSIRALINLSTAETIAGYNEVRFIEPAALARTHGTGDPNKSKNDLVKKPVITNSIKGIKGVVRPRLSVIERRRRIENAVKKYLQEKNEYNPLVLNSGVANSQGDHSHRADDARNRFGYAGQGIKIGVLSDSYNALNGAAADVMNDDLPGTGNPFGNTTPVTVVADYSGGEDEGRAMLQIVHDLAPKAQLFFATGNISEASFASNIVALRSTYGCDIIIDDLGYYDEPVFQDGMVAQAVNKVTAAGAMYFSSAGNEGSLSLGTAGVWEGDFNDTGSPAFTGGNKTGTIHNFGSPLIGDSILSVASGVYNLQWSDPYGASTNDYDLFLISAAGTVKASSTTVQNGTQNPYEQFAPPTLVAGDRLVVFKAASAAVRAISLNTNRGTLRIATTGQTHGHSAAVNAFSVAAIPATGVPFVNTNTVETFTSDGLRRIFYNADSTPVIPGNFLFSTNGGMVRNKPDITAADGVSTTLPASTGLNPFFGTSAAAPHAGAIAALIKSASPSMTSAQIRSLLTSTALDIQAPGYDNVSGYGVLQAYQAMVQVNPTPLPYINVGTITLTEGSYSNGNGAVEPGELGNLIIQLNNTSLTNAPNVIATVTTSTPGITITQGSSNYGTINSSVSATNTGSPIRFAVNSSVACGTAITFQIKVTFNGGVGTLGSTVVSPALGQKSLTPISSTLGSPPPTGSGYTATSGQQTGRVTRTGVVSTCAAAVANPGLTTTTGARQYDAYTFTNTTGVSQCYTVTLSSSNGANLYSAAYNSSGFVPANPSTNFVAAPGSSSTTQTYSFTVAASSAFTVVVHDVNVTPASNSPYTLSITYTSCTAGPACTPVTITTSSIAGGATGTPYDQHFTASGGSGAYLYSVTNLPAGLSVAGDSLSGTPTQAGSFAITVTANDPAGCPSGTKNFTLVIAGDAPDSIAATAGTPQATAPGTTFATLLQATVYDTANAPLSGVNVTFTAPSTGATGTFAGGLSTVTIVTNANGVATAPAFTANTTSGSYTLTATVNGIAPANFSLSNVCPSTIVTSNADNGPGTLRNVIANACPGSTVTFNANINSIVLTSGEIPITKAITITGPGANLLAISGNNLSRIFNITAGTNTVNISGLTVRDGKPQAGTLTTNSTNGGGGILLFSGALNLTGVVITNNDASLTGYAEGGGLDNEGSGLVTITGSSITNNKADEDGGGIAQWGSARMTITNSTISGNLITGGDQTLGGGGIFLYGLTTLTNSTVFGNTGYNAGGNIYRYTSTLTMGNTIVGGGVLTSGATTGKDVYATAGFSSTGYNLIQNTGGYTISGTTTGNQLGVNPKLFPLADYGGTAPTLLPMSNSPVINAGNTALTTGTDQRGNSRYVGGRADIGAVETNYASSATSGTPQTTNVNTQFALPLQVKVTESGNVIAGDTAVFTASATSASGTFANMSNKDTAITNASGLATSHTFTANNTPGTYSDTASIGSAFPSVTFALTNVFPSSITDYFRTKASGNWNDVNTWESSADNINWHAATLTPDSGANTVTVLNTHIVTVTANVIADQLTVNNGGGITVNSGDTLYINDGAGFDFTVAGIVTVQSGGSITLKSTAAGTASIGQSAGTITGSVTVERYVPARRAWRLITAPLTSANTINQAWQNGGVYTTGRGTFITGPGGGNGLDNGNSYSLKTFDVASQLLLPVTNTNQTLSTANGSADNKGYFLFVRGDRNPSNLIVPNSNITTLGSTGSLQVGTQTFEAYGIANNFTLIGNPYASPVDFSLLTRNNVTKRFYAWDPTLNTVGGYVLLDDQDGDGFYSITPASSQTSILQSSQAFFVQTAAAGSASLVFNESSKSSVTTNAGFRVNNGTSEVLRTTLFLKNADTAILADGVLGEFNNNFSKDVTIEDGPKMGNINENLALQRDGHALSIERRPLVDGNDTLFLSLTNTTSRSYTFKFEPSNISSVVTAWLEDAYLKTSTPVSLTTANSVDFSVDANTASADPNRFRIVFKTSGILPISTINVKASQQNGGIQVDWNIATESNMSNYEVEKSANGQDFKKAATAVATGNNNSAVSYNWFDADPFAGNNFYRIKAVSKTGEISYSQVVIVKTGNAKSDIVIYPNPVENRTILLQLINQPGGKYFVQLFNALGQQMLTKTIEHPGGSATQTIQLGSLVSKGVYQLHISNGDNQTNKQVIIQ